MSVAIRFRKAGKSAKKRYNFRIVVCDERVSRDGRFIEEVGCYDPARNPAFIRIKKERIDYWLKQGAKVAPNVMHIIKKGA